MCYFLSLLLLVYGFDKKFKIVSSAVYWLLPISMSPISFEHGQFALSRIEQLFTYIYFQFICYLMGICNSSRFYFDV